MGRGVRSRGTPRYTLVMGNQEKEGVENNKRNGCICTLLLLLTYFFLHYSVYETLTLLLPLSLSPNVNFVTQMCSCPPPSDHL